MPKATREYERWVKGIRWTFTFIDKKTKTEHDMGKKEKGNH